MNLSIILISLNIILVSHCLISETLQTVQHISQQLGIFLCILCEQDCSDGYMCKTHFQVKNGTVMSHQGTSAHVQTFLWR